MKTRTLAKGAVALTIWTGAIPAAESIESCPSESACAPVDKKKPEQPDDHVEEYSPTPKMADVAVQPQTTRITIGYGMPMSSTASIPFQAPLPSEPLATVEASRTVLDSTQAKI